MDLWGSEDAVTFLTSATVGDEWSAVPPKCCMYKKQTQVPSEYIAE